MSMAPRPRLTPQAAKFAILDAAERRLHDEGPEGVRIQRIATDLGITDAAVHYHFGTREALMDALLRRIGRRLVDDIKRPSKAGRPIRLTSPPSAGSFSAPMLTNRPPGAPPRLASPGG